MPEAKSYRQRLYATYATVQAPQWIRASARTLQINQRAILRRLRGWLPVSRSASCLDLGCGAGDLIVALQSLGFKNLTGVDVGPEQVAIARSRGAFVLQADIVEYLRASDQIFDLILAFDIVEHFTKDEVLDLLDLIWQRLKPGGHLIVQTPNALSPWASHYRYHDLTHELMFDTECFASTLRLCGFKDVKFREVGPYIHGLLSAARWVLWKFIRIGYAVLNCVESGRSFGGVYTRNMLACALKDDTAR